MHEWSRGHLVQVWLWPQLKTRCGSVPPGAPQSFWSSHLGLRLTLSFFRVAGPAGSRTDAGAPEFTFTFRSAHDVFREFFGGRDPFADFFGTWGVGASPGAPL